MFSNENDFRENDFFFFFVFGCILEKAPKNILQCYVKERADKSHIDGTYLTYDGT
jgi:hypothetical protein